MESKKLSDFSYDDVLDIRKYLNKSDIEILNRLSENTRNSIYTTIKYDISKMKLLEYYKNNMDKLSKKELKDYKELEQNNISIKEKFDKLLLQLKIF